MGDRRAKLLIGSMIDNRVYLMFASQIIEFFRAKDVTTVQNLAESLYQVLEFTVFGHIFLDFMSAGRQVVLHFKSIILKKLNTAPILRMITGHPSVKTHVQLDLRALRLII